ncbi:hypothetical protein [Phytoactinopolyspora limicola]|uniref:hypothetical protein n=1 Tax=Phytoactinopolyspora limicola TaxID=2715536 RepID=UPI001A9CB105|nr:hypothetical protein [Phytoactinopolyspora limicola]
MDDLYDASDPAHDGLDPAVVEGLVAEFIGPKSPRPIRWHEMSADDYERAFVDLAGWVRWVALRYQLDSRELPPCWWRHGAQTEELTALWGSWEVAYGDRQSASAMADWHSMFAEARERLREWTSRTGCSAREHREGTTPPWADDLYAHWWSEFATAISDELGAEAGTDHPDAGSPE